TVAEGETVKINDPVLLRAFDAGAEVQLIDDVSKERSGLQLYRNPSSQSRSRLVLPITNDKRTSGLAILDCRDAGHFRLQDSRQLEVLTSFAACVLERERMKRDFDQVTDALNRFSRKLQIGVAMKANFDEAFILLKNLGDLLETTGLFVDA